MITNISKQRIEDFTEKEFFTLIKAGFRAKRKMLVGNLSEGLGIHKDKIIEYFDELSIDKKARGEDLPIGTWMWLTKKISSHTKHPHEK